MSDEQDEKESWLGEEVVGGTQGRGLGPGSETRSKTAWMVEADEEKAKEGKGAAGHEGR